MGNPNSSGATNEEIYNRDFRLCGCAGHGSPSVPAPAPRPQLDWSAPSPGVNRIEDRGKAITPLERVLVYGSEDIVSLQDVGVAGKTPFFGSDGYLVDLSGRRLPGSQILAALPVELERLGETFTWPFQQSPPFGTLPVDARNVNVGFARNSFDFGDGHSLVTVGAAVPKILKLKNGGATLWVTSAQVITQGTGVFAGARGIQSFAGTSYFSAWPGSPNDQVGLLTKPFKAKIHRCIRAVLKENQGA